MVAAKDPLRITYAVLLSLNEGSSTGTGFRVILEDYVYLVTARHVIYGNKGIRGDSLIATSYGLDDLDLDPLIVSIDLTTAKIAEEEKTDTAVILIGRSEKKHDNPNKKQTKLEDYATIIQRGVGSGRNVPSKLTKTLDGIELGSEVFLIGYPTSLGLIKNEYYDFRKPLLRKGSVAGKDGAKGTFVIDCPSYPGNSGAPVVERCEDGSFRIIGFASRYIPFETKWYSNRENIHNTEISNSGYTVCVAMDSVIALSKKIAP